ncbi:30S ribosomal protein S3ae [Candidatus Parvarchaeota archaeon]|nr:30S ribosomal protein S3ae [Candidatus Parvarchaeota archaeon]
MAEVQQQAKKSKGKVIDTWKTKSWYTVIAPEIFNSKEIGQLVSSDEANLLGRKVKANLSDLTGALSMSGAYTAIYFKVNDVKGKSAHTEYVGHELAPAYIRTLARRRRSVINNVADVATKDGRKIRVKSTVVTAVRVSDRAKSSLRAMIQEEVKSYAANADFNQFVQDILFGKLSQKIYSRIKKVSPIKKIEIHKTQTIQAKKKD